MGPQIGSLEHGAHILVGTPGRILDHLEKGRINLNELNTLVLDEADRMLEMGFQDALDAIIAEAPSERQTLLFSATFPEKIQQIANRIMQKPEMVKVESTHDNSSISQHFYKVEDDNERMDALETFYWYISLNRQLFSVIPSVKCRTWQMSFTIVALALSIFTVT